MTPREYPAGFWHPLWPHRDELESVLLDPERRIKPPHGVATYGFTAQDVARLCTDSNWALWVWNPDLDFVVCPAKCAPQHWANMCLAPLHAPCKLAIRALGPALMQRITHGEVVPSHRTRYVSPRAPKLT